eukprot:scaffold7732_cov122-Isochrysis_galbana.AAC.1
MRGERRTLHLGESISPCELFESAPVERVQREVEFVQPGGAELWQRARERHACVERPNHVHQVRADGGLAARQPDLVDALAHKQRGQPQHLFHRQQPVGPGQRDAVGGHAVHAPQRAALRERNAQIGVVPAESVHESRRHAVSRHGGGGHRGSVLGHRPVIGQAGTPLAGDRATHVSARKIGELRRLVSDALAKRGYTLSLRRAELAGPHPGRLVQRLGHRLVHAPRPHEDREPGGGMRRPATPVCRHYNKGRFYCRVTASWCGLLVGEASNGVQPTSPCLVSLGPRA